MASPSSLVSTAAPLHFVLVHGYQSGGWCWYKIGALMKESGYKFSCPDLKSAGVDPTDPHQLKSFEDYNKPLIDLLSALPENDKVILVGHSAGGLSVTHACHKFGQRIHLAIYVAATMLRRGFQTREDFKIGIPNSSQQGNGAEAHGYPVISLPDKILGSLLRKKNAPLQAIRSANFSDNPSVDRVQRVYIKTLHDEVLHPRDQQSAMINKWKPAKVFEIESDHSANVSDPEKLFQLIVKAAQMDSRSLIQ